jgi:DNA primase small subunit
LDAYYSGAYYANPEAEMDKKGWEGADLIFDIDADHIPTKCGKIHDEWLCRSCGFAGKGTTPEQCPACEGQKFHAKTWLCPQCLEDAKNETFKLLGMLENDFGFKQSEMRTFYSGHRGYHVHIENDTVKMLDASARKEIVDYIIGLGLETGFSNPQGVAKQHTIIAKPPNLGDLGWRGRLARSMYDFVLKTDARDYGRLGVKKKPTEILLRNRDAILKGWEGTSSFRAVRGVGSETWKKIAGACVLDSTAKIDTVVTTDTHRLIRMAGTLHSKTALKKVEFSPSKVLDFDPFTAAVAFKRGNVTVFISDAPAFRLSGEEFGPYKNCRVELPTAAALLLVCKGRAEVVG